MMKRFSRKRRSGGGGRGRSIEASEWLPKIVEAGLVEAARLEPWTEVEVPNTVAAIGRGERADGSPILVAFSPTSATQATLGGLAAAQQLSADEPFKGQVQIVAPQWPTGARRILALLGRTPYTIEPVAAPALSDGPLVVEADPEPPVLSTGSQQLAARMTSPDARAALRRAAIALEGLAAKHGGCVRVGIDRLELVVLARRVAEIRTEGENAVLEIQIGGRSVTPLSGADLAGALDGLEGQVRRRLNDRKVREGEEGLRGRVIGQLASGSELRGLCPWPQPGTELDDIDGVGVNEAGEPVVVAVREEFDWSSLAAVLESLTPLGGLLPVLFADIAPPLRLGAPRLLLAGERFAAGLERALSALVVAYELRDVSGSTGPALDLVSRSSGEGAEQRPSRRGRRRGGRSGRGGGGEDRGDREDREDRPSGPARDARPKADEERSASAEGNGEGDESGRGRSRRRRRPRRGRGGSSEGAEGDNVAREGRENEEGRSGEGARKRPRRFEEVSLMDLDEGPGASADSKEEDTESGSSRRRRPRRRGRRSGGESEGGDALLVEASEPEEAPPTEEEDLVDADDLEEILARLPDDVPEFDVEEPTDLSYDDEEEVDDDGEGSARRASRETQRRARKDASDDAEDSRAAARRRSAILVHADRDSLLAAMLLARDIRQLDGMWVYPQEELMTFFRSVATDLRDDTPIFIVGFSPSPAHDVVQAASLYRGRLTWFDRRAWPPEDLSALRDSLGADAIHGGNEIDSSLPLVLETCSRRSRFSDKLVDLATGRFTQHDYERWGRLWWHRAGEIAQKTGDVRGDIAPILTGRPSDLAKEAALVSVPPAPPEVAWVAERDFRLVHFGGHVMVVVPVESPMDIHLAGRIARERYGATLSLAYREGGESFAFGGEETNGKRSLDYLAVVEHLVDKLEWVEARPDADHVARFRVRDLDRHPERAEELIGEIAMGRSLLER